MTAGVTVYFWIFSWWFHLRFLFLLIDTHSPATPHSWTHSSTVSVRFCAGRTTTQWVRLLCSLVPVVFQSPETSFGSFPSDLFSFPLLMEFCVSPERRSHVWQSKQRGLGRVTTFFHLMSHDWPVWCVCVCVNMLSNTLHNKSFTFICLVWTHIRSRKGHFTAKEKTNWPQAWSERSGRKNLPLGKWSCSPSSYTEKVFDCRAFNVSTVHVQWCHFPPFLTNQNHSGGRYLQTRKDASYQNKPKYDSFLLIFIFCHFLNDLKTRSEKSTRATPPRLPFTSLPPSLLHRLFNNWYCLGLVCSWFTWIEFFFLNTTFASCWMFDLGLGSCVYNRRKQRSRNSHKMWLLLKTTEEPN